MVKRVSRFIKGKERLPDPKNELYTGANLFEAGLAFILLHLVISGKLATYITVGFVAFSILLVIAICIDIAQKRK